MPWISLGAGYKPPSGAENPATTPYTYTVPWDYPLWYSWQIGRDVLNATARPGVAADFAWAKAVALYPSAFDQRSQPLDGRGDITTMLLHFAAYVRGAAGIPHLPAH